jgi:hypothetical protein
MLTVIDAGKIICFLILNVDGKDFLSKQREIWREMTKPAQTMAS